LVPDLKRANKEAERKNGKLMQSWSDLWVRKRGTGRLIGLAILLVFASAIPQIHHVDATGELALDGNGFGSATGGGCTWTQTLSTTKTPDVIVALLVVNDTTTSVTPPTDTASLSWTLRAKQAGPSNVQIFFFYAIATKLLIADSINFGLSSTAVSAICEDFGISGANTITPFDPGPGMPSWNSGTSTINSVTYNTSNPNDFLIILQGFCAQGSAGSGSPSGFTTIVGSGNAHVSSSNCPSDFLQSNSFYKIVSATQSSNIVSWTFDVGSSPFAIIGDAIQSAPGPLSASVIAGSNVVDVGQLASFSCTGAGGVSPYTYSWTFGDGSTGSGAVTSHIYNSPGTMTVVCTVMDQLGTPAKDETQVLVSSDPSINSFAASPTSLYPGDKVTFGVSASGGYGGLSYSYANLPAGCFSTNSTTLSCTPTSSGNYNVTVTVTDHLGKSATATVRIAVGPQKVLGLPPAMGMAVIFGGIAGIGAIVIVSIALVLRRKNRRQAP
jgi:hypothetical protein